MSFYEETLQAYQWFIGSSLAQEIAIVEHRDIFQAKLDAFLNQTLKVKKLPKEELFEIYAVLGEIGNNCFDHNLGFWKNNPGCVFEWAMEKDFLWAVIADQGRGIFRSLSNAHPEISNPQIALDTAFEKTISGRYPEKRGNGLKFVRKIINANSKRGLFCISDEATICFGGLKDRLLQDIAPVLKPKQNTGVLSVICWKSSK